MDWLAYGLPLEKKPHGAAMVIDHMQKEFPVARLSDPVGDIRLRLEQAGFAVCPVLSHEGVLLGVIDRARGSADPATPAGAVMDPGPAAVRPSISVDSAVKQLARQKAGEMLVTSSDGKLIGIFRRPKIPNDDRLPESGVSGVWD